MIDPAYPPARTAAPTLHEQLARRHAEARRTGGTISGPLPEVDVIERLIEAAFWASLRREEGRSPQISLAFVPKEQSGDALVLDRRLPISPGALTRLAPAVERPGIHLCIWGTADDLHVWGATRMIPDLCLVLEVVEPGLVVAKYGRGDAYGKFGNLAMLKGDRVKVVDENAARRPDCPGVLASLTGRVDADARLGDSSVLVQLALSMRAHGHGGSLLVVPAASAWEQSILSPISYRVTPPFSRLAELVRTQPEESDRKTWMDEVRLAIDGLAGLTAVDGAMVMTTQYELLAFGAKIARVGGAPTAGKLVLLEPVVGHTPVVIEAAELGGTRHLSAAQFVHDQRDALALVASQDGRFTIFLWSDFDERIHAHRIETLLL